MNNYDRLMYLILGRILTLFGMRIAGEKRIVFLYRIRNYTNAYGKKETVKVITLTEDISEAFAFLNMDYDDYKKQEFKTIFDFTSWVTDNCKYLTVGVIRNIEREVNTTPKGERDEILSMAGRFAETVKIGHVVLRDFQYAPLVMYDNLREKIVRNFFYEEKVQNEFINLKLIHLKEVELPGKFSPLQVVSWIRPLRAKPILTGIFTTSFVNYITQYETAKFPRFLVDADVASIKKEVISYYYNIFPQSEMYRAYVLEHKEENEVE